MTYVVILIALASSFALADRITTDLSGGGWRLWRDSEAKWQDDELFAPPIDLAKLPHNPPTGGWDSLWAKGLPVNVPGTTEEYLGNGMGSASEVRGVTWWCREITVPATTTARKYTLTIESARQRTEVYLDHQLVGYDVVGNTPFDADLTGLLKLGQTHQLALRITNPGGTFDWMDFFPAKWGKYPIPMSHAFGGITGRVRLLSLDPVYVQDLYVQNTPKMREINVLADLSNSLPQAAARDIQISVLDKDGKSVATTPLPQTQLKPGSNRISATITVPDALLWDLDQPNLYTCMVHVSDGKTITDSDSRKFGFRWFAPEGIGQDAVFRLNGKRIVLRTAISWGFWPTNGLYATPEIAEKQILSARSLGMNMLNFHRSIGSPIVLDKADELGLLYFEEPGGYVSAGRDTFAQALAREKLLRMVRRDRSHPSLVIYNMINEQWTDFGADKDEQLFGMHKQDMRDAHTADPSRIITYTSAWAYDANKPQRAKLHMRPFDQEQYFVGWQDIHRATGPETWHQSDYKTPTDFYGRTTNTQEIVYNGEEGAISSPPRLALIKEQLAKQPRNGWDGAVYLKWYDAFEQFITRKDLRDVFPTVDSLTCAMGAVSLEHQGRKTENMRICNANDGYATNGWEAEISEDHSGIVDCFRNPKADPAIMAYYNQPLYVAVKVRQQIVQPGDQLLVDFYAINEKNQSGAYSLRISTIDTRKTSATIPDIPITLAGGETFGQLLAEAVKVPTTVAPGMMRIRAELVDSNGKPVASGRDDVLVVDWRKDAITGRGAICERGSRVSSFLASAKQVSAPTYSNDASALDWIVVARPMLDDPEVIPTSALRDASGQKNGLTATFFRGKEFSQPLHERIDAKVDMNLPAGAPPDPAVALTENYCVRWEGTIIPPVTGNYIIAAGGDDGVRLWLDDKLVIDDWKIHQFTQTKCDVRFEANQRVKVKLEFFQAAGESRCKLSWVVPDSTALDVDRLMRQAQDGGSTLLFLDRADTWLPAIEKYTAVHSGGAFGIGSNWLGGQFFVREHPLFDGLPVNCAMNWPYQRVVAGANRYALRLEGEQLVAGAYQSWPFDLGTSVAVIPCGKGKIVLSALAICDYLGDSDNTAHVARKLLCNYLRYAMRR